MKSKNSRNTLILLGLLGLVLAISYPLLNQNSSPANVPTALEEAGVASAIALLGQIQAVNFDFSILKTAEFMHLKDMTTSLPNLPLGTTNPFSK